MRKVEKIMKKICLFYIALGFTLPGYAQEQGFALGNFTFSLSPKIMEEGSITDAAVGLAYTRAWGGELRFRSTIISKNEFFQGVEDSLNAVNENIYEIFFLPGKYYVQNLKPFLFWLGGGIYYEYDKLREKGFFNMPILEELTPPRERVNAYTNEFSMHLAGPLFEFGAQYGRDLFRAGRLGMLGFTASLSCSIVPVFLLSSAQKMSMVPLLDPDYAEHSQLTGGSPYFNLSFDMILFSYLNITLLYDIARLRHDNISFDENLDWITAEQTVISQSFKIETSLLIPLGSSIRAQIGFGYTFDSTGYDDMEMKENRAYLILSARKSGL
jgi:hypothetical protein